MNLNSLQPSLIDVSLEDIEELRQNLKKCRRIFHDVSDCSGSLKRAPTFSRTQLAEMLKLPKATFARQWATAAKQGLPLGSAARPRGAIGGVAVNFPDNGKGRREFLLQEVQVWLKYAGRPLIRPPGAPGAVICVASLHNTLSKVKTTMSIAQGLSLRGYRVLCIDLDPEGLLTNIFGILSVDVSSDQTVLPVISGAREGIRDSIRSTYWHNVHLVAANQAIFECNFYLPARQFRDPNFQFVQVLQRALDDGTREDYDFILIDTPPPFDYLTMNAYWAADAILMSAMPFVQSGLDLMSNLQFWEIFCEHVSSFNDGDSEKFYSWIGVLLSKNSKRDVPKNVKLWAKAGFGRFLLDTIVPVREEGGLNGAMLKTVYDLSRDDMSINMLHKLQKDYDELVSEIEELTWHGLWKSAPKG